MSDEEEYMSEEETEEQEEEEAAEEEAPEEAAPPPRRVSTIPPEDSGPTEAELAMQRRRANQISSAGLDEAAKELLEENAKERDQMSQEIQELRERSERRKQERIQEEKELQARRIEEDARRKTEEEERKKAKEEQERERREKREAQMKEFAKQTEGGKPNFVVIKKSNELVGGGGDEAEKDEGEGKMSREQMEQERKAILSQRIVPLQIDGFDAAKLTDKAKSLHKEILRLEGEKYDLEKRFKEQQYDMLEMAERARQINKVGKTGLKRVVLKDDERDTIQERFSGAPSKIELYSRFERQPDKRVYKEKHTVFTGPTYIMPPEKIAPCRIVKWDENTGLPIYEDIPGMQQPEEEAEA